LRDIDHPFRQPIGGCAFGGDGLQAVCHSDGLKLAFLQRCRSVPRVAPQDKREKLWHKKG
jgi:hypothetical protein